MHEGTDEVLEFLREAYEAKVFPVWAEHRERRRVAVVVGQPRWRAVHGL